MHGKRDRITYGVPLFVGFTFFVLSNLGTRTEKYFGLPIIYEIRNIFHTPTSPEIIFILTPYKIRIITQADVLRDWSRDSHTEILILLDELGVAVTAIDLIFREPKGQEDMRLSKQIENSNSVLLTQIARNVMLSEKGKSMTVLRNSTSKMADSAAALAPVLIAGSMSRSDSYCPIYPVIYDESENRSFGFLSDKELPEQRLKELCTELNREYILITPQETLELLLAESNSFENAILDEHGRNVSPNSVRHCDFTHQLRSGLIFKKYSNKIENIAEKYRYATEIWLATVKTFAGKEKYSGITQTKLHNLYGPPKTVRTFGYLEFLQLSAEIKFGVHNYMFNGAVVFVGGSFNDAANQKHASFVTAQSSISNPMSGVEITATAFDKLVSGKWLSPFYSKIPVILHVELLSIAMYFIAVTVSNRLLVIYAYILSVGASLWAFILFKYLYLVPFLVPILSVILITSVAVVRRLFVESQNSAARQKHLNFFLFELITNQLKMDQSYRVSLAICLVTDIRNFTSISSTLPVEELHVLCNEYFTKLFDCAENFGADVKKTYGDSMTIVLTIKQGDSCSMAIDAGHDLLRTVDGFNICYPSTPFVTSVGMSRGDVAIGYVGDDFNKTVEITGGAVYLASRLEQLNKRFKTIILTTVYCVELINIDDEPTQLRKSKIRGFKDSISVVRFAW